MKKIIIEILKILVVLIFVSSLSYMLFLEEYEIITALKDTLVLSIIFLFVVYGEVHWGTKK